MNVLISSIISDYTANWMANLLDKFTIDQCAVVFDDTDLINNSRIGIEYATETFIHDDCVHARYDINNNEFPPLDDEILQQLEPYERTALLMLERCSGRSFMSHWRDYCIHIQYWNHILDKFCIELFLSTTIPHEGFNYIIYALCKIKGIKIVGAFFSHFLGYSYLFSDIENQIPKFEEYLKNMRRQYEGKTIEDIPLNAEMNEMFEWYYGDNQLTPWYMKTRNEDLEIGLRKRLKNIMLKYKLSRGILMVRQRIHILVWCLVHLFSYNVETYKKAEWIAQNTDIFREYELLHNFYEKNAHPVDYNRKYVYVALHMQPEVTSSPLGKTYVDQVLMVKMLSHCLPEGYALYVKEHPSQLQRDQACFGYRTLHFFQDLLNLPNVYFVPQQEDTYKLIQSSCAVASLTGTAGFEAIINNKLFFMFGYYLTQYAPNVLIIRNTQDCLAAMEKMVQYRQCADESKRQMKIYFKALQQFQFKGYTGYENPLMNALPEHYPEETEQNVVKAFSEKIVEMFGETILKSKENSVNLGA